MPVDDFWDVNKITKYGRHFETFVKQEVFAFNVMVQLFFLVVFAFVAFYSYQDLIKQSHAFFKKRVIQFHPITKRVLRAYHEMMGQIIMCLLMVGYMCIGYVFKFPLDVILLGFKVVGSYILIRFTTVIFIKDPNLAKLTGVFLYIVTLSLLLNFLDGTLKFLGIQKFAVMGHEITLLSMINGVILLSVLLWSSLALSNFAERKIKSVKTLTPSVKVLLAKLSKFLLVALACLIGLTHIGLDLSVFALFGGAVGVGIGLGLQKVFSNLVSGVILLLDRSIKPGDIITVGDTYGRVDALGARYTSVMTTGGKEYLIPNEDMITNQVINWSFSSDLVSNFVALKFDKQVDLKRVMAICENAIKDMPRILADPPPKCVVTGFGDYWITVNLQFWITDPMNGFSVLKSDIYLAVWDALKKHKISMPFLDYTYWSSKSPS